VLLDREGARHRLGVLAECGPADIKTLVVFILAFDGTDFGAFAATRALGGIHITRLLQKLYREISRLTGNLLNFRQGQKLDIQVPADLDQLGRDNSHRAVVCGEGFVELRHHSADSGGFFDQINIKTSVGKIERRLHAGDTATNDHNGTNRSIFLGLHESTPLKFLMICQNNDKNTPRANEYFSVENLVGVGAMRT
jgi:hypothetical protein